MVCGLGVLLSIDVLAFGLRRPPLVALPLLVTLSVPVSILQRRARAAGLRRHRAAVPAAARHRARRPAADAGVAPTRTHRRAGAGRRSGRSRIVAVVVALAGRAVHPGRRPARPDPATARAGAGRRAATSSPRSTRSSGCGATSSSRRTPRWCTPRPTRGRRRTSAPPCSTSSPTTSGGPRRATCPSDNRADGVFPNPPGLAAGVGGTDGQLDARSSRPNFGTTWLPLPYPIRELDDRGHLALRRAHPRRRLRRRRAAAGAELRGHVVHARDVTAQLLDSRDAAARAGCATPMTAVPDDLPDVIATRARGGDRGRRAPTSHKAVALQDWFRSDGGFRYSLEQRSGSGHGPARRLRHQRPGRLLRAVRRGDGRDGTRARTSPRGWSSASCDGDAAARRPDPLHQRRPARVAGDVLRRRRAGCASSRPRAQRAGATPAWTRQDRQRRRHRRPAPSASRRAEPSAPTPDDAAADDAGRRRPAACRSRGGRWPRCWCCWCSWPGARRSCAASSAGAGSCAADPVHLAEGRLGRAARDRPRPRAGLARAALTARAGPQRRRPGARRRGRRTSRRWRAAGAGGAGPLRPVADGAVGTVDPELRSRTVETVESWRRAMVGSVRPGARLARPGVAGVAGARRAAGGRSEAGGVRTGLSSPGGDGAPSAAPCAA